MYIANRLPDNVKNDMKFPIERCVGIRLNINNINCWLLDKEEKEERNKKSTKRKQKKKNEVNNWRTYI